jgi:malate dehydrogenase (oxaloacetate-decarboxylating)
MAAWESTRFQDSARCQQALWGQAARARRVTDGMLLAAARAVAGLVDISTPGAPLLPRVADLRETSVAVAAAIARAADAEGVASAPLDADLAGQVRALMWEPRYRPVRPA